MKAEGLQFQSVQSATSCKLSSGSTCTSGDVVFFSTAASNGEMWQGIAFSVGA